MAPEAAVAACRSVAGALRGSRSSSVWERCSVQERYRSVSVTSLDALQEHAGANVVRPAASGSETKSQELAGVKVDQSGSSGPPDTGSGSWRHKSVAWPQKQQLQCPGALQECCVAPEAAIATSRSVARGLRVPRSSSCSARERCRSAAWPQKHQMQRALQERGVAPEAAVAESGSVAGLATREGAEESRSGRIGSVSVAGLGALQCLRVAQERCRRWIGCISVAGSVTGALQRHDSKHCNVRRSIGGIGSVAGAGALQGHDSLRCKVRERYRR